MQAPAPASPQAEEREPPEATTRAERNAVLLVTCLASFLTPFINYVLQDQSLNYLPAANEGDAIASIAGVTLGGRRGVAMMQNSGLGNAVSPLTRTTAQNRRNENTAPTPSRQLIWASTLPCWARHVTRAALRLWPQSITRTWPMSGF